MTYRLILVPQRPNEVVLEEETKLCGLEFVSEASSLLRCNLDDYTKFTHVTLGNLTSYTISVPIADAIASGKFENCMERYLIVESGSLNKYIFHTAVAKKARMNHVRDRCSHPTHSYPYYQDEVVLFSRIDELAFLEDWKNTGYADKMVRDAFIGPDIVADDTDVDNPSEGEYILDDILRGCL